MNDHDPIDYDAAELAVDVTNEIAIEAELEAQHEV